MLGVTISGGEIDRWQEPGEGALGWCAPRDQWPSESLRVAIEFVHGEAVAIDGRKLAGGEILKALNPIFARYGVGRVRILSVRGAWTYCELPTTTTGRGWLPSDTVERVRPPS